MTHVRKAQPVVLRQRRLAAQNSKWEVFWDDITGSDGRQVDGYLVIAPRVCSVGHIGGVTIVPVLADGSVGLVRSYRHPLELDAWEAPRGFLEPGEADLAAAALRELEEETGYTSALDMVVALGTFAQEPATIASMSALFAALDCTPTGTAPDLGSEPGLGEIKFFTLGEALGLADSGAIQDAATLLTLYRYSRQRSR